ncbi:YfiT family bacillithiol transferase [Bacillus sp. NPDC077027]|uniref:YfiT family bacillithiol transferase n=1 Tax=Bacillus sp. NPDC077027 TaxID=3390548 RepID=UPI003D089C56
MTSLQYPIGQYEPTSERSEQQLKEWIGVLEDIPKQLKEATKHLTKAQLDTPYRPEGWTIRQVVHHMADTHMNAYLRFKIAITEEAPHIRPFDQQRFAELPDSKAPIEISLQLIDILHAKWVLLLEGMNDSDFEKTYYHPVYQKTIALYHATGMYVWHSKHHLAHITELKKRSGWS